MNTGTSKLRGFTLIELLIVIVILGLLGSLVAPTMFSKVDSSMRKTASAQISNFETALDTYRLDIGRYPDRLQQLRVGEHPNWDGPYLPKEIPTDPWGNEYQYKKPGSDGRAYDLYSLGKDGQPGGEDDNEDIYNQ
ncbi:type II secretion system major pseudopilin GspG [Idiomarina seosinensis]|uniref:type II secretion system major pseudopilin GspG n=1 Tax=Idiomarina seosinensis TaxID=281739 RepID=UPI0038503D81